MNVPFLDQMGFRFRNDDGDEAAATWRQAKDVDDTQDVDTVYRVRIEVSETAGNASNNNSFQLEIQRNGGGFQNVDAASTIVQSAASQLVDGNDTTQQISAPDTFVTPNAGQDEVNGIAGGPTNDFAGSDSGEYEYSYQIIGADVNDADTLDFRIQGLDAYTVADGTVTVNKPGPPGPPPGRRTLALTGAGI